MKKTVTVLLLAVLLLSAAEVPAESGWSFSLPTPVGAAAQPAADGELEAEAIRIFKSARVFCGALIVTRNGRDVLRVTYGDRDHLGHPVSLDTRFRVASVTKLVSAIGLMTLYDEGRFSLDQPLGDILPFPVVNPMYPDRPVTPRQTLSHTSSIDSSRYHPRWEELPKVNQYFSQDFAPGDAYLYANLNGGLTGAMIEALSGQSVNSFMTERVFGPLAIDAAYHAGLLKDQTDIAEMLKPDGSIHAGARKQVNTVKSYNDTCDPRQNTDKTVGSLYISVEGMSRLAQLLLNGGVYGGRRCLREATVRLMEKDQQALPGSSMHCDSPYGLGMIRVEDAGAYPWYGHQGRYLGLVANLYYQPATGLTFAMAVTAYNGSSVNNVANITRRMLKLLDGSARQDTVQ